MATQTTTMGESKVSSVITTIAAIIAIIAFIFGFTKWGDIQQFFWRQRIVGTWQDESGILTNFTSDGTFTSGGLLPASGYYTFSDGDHIILQVSGLLGIMGDQSFEVSFSGNTMTMRSTTLGMTTTFTRH